MTLPAPTYDLVLLLDAEAEEPARTKILADTRAAIAAQGELLRDDEWGDRALTYPIDHKTTAKYHLLQFHAGSTELLQGLDRSLRIADEVVRFRIVKLKPGTPEAPDMRTAGAIAREVAPAAESQAAAEPQAGVQPAPAPQPEPEVETAPATETGTPSAAETEEATPEAKTAPAPVQEGPPAPAAESESPGESA
ncbi:MAG TPA: 30S ribosomal protein S6 [Solirubrobacteraceae bacterium]|jgi:small subunit ribosomal protein S6|nr:30S ribosomal protein S6 [Solirubrobacteraceae bacterium]